MKKILNWSLVVIWMIVIFVYSNQPAVISNEKSKFVIYAFQTLGLNLNGMFGELANFVVRKLGHFSEYMLFYIFLFRAFKIHLNLKKALLFSIISVFLYACSDEIHQLFVPGRSGMFRDVLIDTFGGAMAMFFIYFKNSKIKQKKY